MKHLHFLLLVCLILPVACVSEPPLNIILIHVDDLGWTDLSSYGSVFYETPNIDRLAEEGTRFTDAYAAAAICSPSRAAVMTGRYPARLGITDWIRASFQPTAWKPGTSIPEFVSAEDRHLATPANQPYLPLDEITLAEHLKQAGYVTAHLGKWHLGRDEWYPDKQGFDYNIGGCDFGQPPSYFDPYVNARVNGIPTLPPRREGEYLTDREADEAVRFIRTHNRGPFFLYYAPYAVHTPIEAKPEVVEKYQAKVKTNQSNPAYAAMIEGVDDAVGRILSVLGELTLVERTLLFFTSDNGGLIPVTDNAPLRDGKGSPYEGGIRVPLIVWCPGVVQPGTTSDLPVAGIDYFPTIAEAAGVPVSHPIDGVSFWPEITGRNSRDERELFWHFPHYRYTQVGPYSIVRSGDWKLIRYYDPEPYEKNPVELFNLVDDQAEQNDLASVQPEKVQQLESKLDTWLKRQSARMPQPKRVSSESRE